MSYRYLAGYRHGHRLVGEKKYAHGHQKDRVRHHIADKGGRMYWCGCMAGWRLNGEPRWGSGPSRTKTFSHHHGSTYHQVRWQRRPLR